MACDTCIKEKEIELLREDIRILKGYRDIDKEDMHSIKEMMIEMQGDIKAINKTVKDMSKTIDLVQADTEELKNKPYKRYDKIAWASIVSLVGLLIKTFYDYFFTNMK